MYIYLKFTPQELSNGVSHYGKSVILSKIKRKPLDILLQVFVYL